MTLMRPCRQSVVLGTRMTLAVSGTESSSSLQIMTGWGQLHPRLESPRNFSLLGCPFRAVTWASADWTLG